MARKIHMKPSVKYTSESRLYRRVKFRSCGIMGYGPTMCFKSRKDADILHAQGMSEDSLLVMLATTLVPSAWDEDNNFLLVETRRTNRQSSRPSVVTGMSTAIITGSY